MATFRAVQRTLNPNRPQNQWEQAISKRGLALKAMVDEARAVIEEGPSDSVSLVSDDGRFATFSGKIGAFDEAVDLKGFSQITFRGELRDGSKVEVTRNFRSAPSKGLRSGLFVASRLTFGLAGGLMRFAAENMAIAGRGNQAVWNAAARLDELGEKASNIGAKLEHSKKPTETFSLRSSNTGDEASFWFTPDGSMVHIDMRRI